MTKIRIKDVWDLVIVIFVSLFVVVLCIMPIWGILRIVLGIPFILFLPGYSLVSTIFPERRDLEHLERFALSIGLSISIVPLTGFVLNYITGIKLIPLVLTISIITIFLSILAIYRRSVSREPYIPPIPMPTKAYILMIGVAILLIYSITVPPTEEFTEFYLLGSEGKAKDYPTELKVGQEGKVIIGIINHEGRTVNYTVEVWLDNNVSYRLLDSFSVRLEPVPPTTQWRPQWEKHYTFSIKERGNYTLWFLLFKDGYVDSNGEDKINDAIEGKIQYLKLPI